jgi:D-glycero-D-manno-heptose 1,7-bisphosphate phosphatase
MGMLLVRTSPDAPKHKGITFLLIDMSLPGIEVRPLVQPTGASHFNEVFLTDVRVPVSNVLGEIDAGWGPARTVLSNESAFIGGGQAGSIHEKLVLLARHFGRTDDPVVRQGLATSYTRERILGNLGERILSAVRRREVPPVDPSILKLYVAQNRVQSGNLAGDIAGAAAIAGPDEMSRWIQFELMGRYGISIGGGTDEVQRNNLAERALGLPKEMRDDHVKAALEWEPVPGALEAVARLNHAGWHAVVATNQAGIGRGMIDMAQVNSVHAHMHRLLMAQGARVDAVFFCPHTPEDHCDCRKPLPGMMREIGRRYGVDLAQVPMVCDTLRDLLAAQAAGCEPHLVMSGRAAAIGDEQLKAMLAQVPGAHAHADLAAFAEHLLAREQVVDSGPGVLAR